MKHVYKVLRFDPVKGNINDSKKYCVLGALGKARNLGIDNFPGPEDDTAMKSLVGVAPHRLTVRALKGLIWANDTRHWSYLTTRLAQLRLYTVVKPLAKKVFKNKTVVL